MSNDSIFIYDKRKLPQQILTVIGILVLGFTAGWGYALTFFAGCSLWGIRLRS